MFLGGMLDFTLIYSFGNLLINYIKFYEILHAPLKYLHSMQESQTANQDRLKSTLKI